MSCLNDFLQVRGKVLVPFYRNRSQQISSKHSNEHYLGNLKCFISLSFPCHPTVLPMEHYLVSSVSSEKFHLPPEKQLESCKMGPYYKIPHSPSHFKLFSRGGTSFTRAQQAWIGTRVSAQMYKLPRALPESC